MGEVTVQRLKPDEVTLDTTRYFQGMALRAWQQGLPHRPVEELLNLCNPYDPGHLKDRRQEYQEFADQDGLLAAVAKVDNEEVTVGFLLTKEDVSGSGIEQALKRRFRPEKIYAFIQHVAVAPEMQRKGVAKRLGREALASYGSEQISTIYVFDEHEFAMKAVGRYGYELEPVDQDPTPRHVFGYDASPVYQYRFAAPVGRVLERLAVEPENT